MGDAVSLNTLEFAGARAQEIACMEEVLRMANRDRAKRAFQRLPRHMRRRQMSHNVKRLPRNMRDQARWVNAFVIPYQRRLILRQRLFFLGI